MHHQILTLIVTEVIRLWVLTLKCQIRNCVPNFSTVVCTLTDTVLIKVNVKSSEGGDQ